VTDPALDEFRRRRQELDRQPVFRRAAPSTLRAAWWAWRSVRLARRQLRADGIRARVDPPPRLPWGSRGGVYGVLHRLDPTCIERALVEQAWLRSFDLSRDVVVGVKTEDRTLQAHAWLDGLARPSEHASYRVIHRISP
jgi:hypothetical protein